MRTRPALQRLTGPALRVQPRAAGHQSVLWLFLKMALLHFKSQTEYPQCMLKCGGEEGEVNNIHTMTDLGGQAQAMVVLADMVLAI